MDLDLAFSGAARQAELIRGGELSSRELVEGDLGRIAELDPRVNAFRLAYGERALAEADQADARVRAGDERPLLGVPVAIKDNVDVAGDLTCYGTRSPREPATADSEVVRRLRGAGAVLIGRTHLPELAIFPFTESASWGLTRNPWSARHTCGGSSGGSAAAVAAG
ncbi:MAG TPA: amidase family protein, partial [Thermoleophilaceae bacterium]